MRNFLDAKAMAKALKATLKQQDIDISHSQALETVAAQFGFSDWNVLAAKIDAATVEAATDASGIALHAPSPIFRIFDEQKVKEFYIDFLGFRLDWEHRFGDNFPLYCQVSRSGMTLHLSGHHGDASPGATAYVTMSGVVAYQKELAGRNYAHMKPGIEEQPWGKEMTVIDPFSNRIRFCEPSAE